MSNEAHIGLPIGSIVIARFNGERHNVKILGEQHSDGTYLAERYGWPGNSARLHADDIEDVLFLNNVDELEQD